MREPRQGPPRVRVAAGPPPGTDRARRRRAPAPHTSAELEKIMGLLTQRHSRISAISLGHARDDASRSAANAIIRAWADHGGEVLGVVDWPPEDAASWLHQATRLVAGAPDVWVVAGSPLGWTQMVGPGPALPPGPVRHA